VSLRIHHFAFFVLLFITAACAHANGRLESNRYQHSRYPYAVFYADGGAAMTPIGTHWRVDNFTRGQEAGPLNYRPKDGRAYWVKRLYDLDDDGTFETKRKEEFYDLLLEHHEKDAQLWVRTVPISTHDRGKDLSVLAERYVEAVAGSGSVAVQFGSEGPVGSIERRFASRVLGTRDCMHNGRAAHRIDFEVANVDQLQLSDSARWVRGSLVLVRTGYSERVDPSQSRPSVMYPVLMLVGVSARPQDYAGIASDFDLLLQKTVLGDVGKGLAMHGETTCSTLAPAVDAPAAAPAETSGNEAPASTIEPEAASPTALPDATQPDTANAP